MLLASSPFDKTVRLWETATGAALLTLKGHWDQFNTVAFSLDSKLLASALFDEPVRLWELGTSTALQKFEVNAIVRTLSFSDNGSSLKTDWGLLDVTSLCGIGERSLTHGIFIKERRVMWETEKLLWLASDYQPTCAAVRGSIVALGQASGWVSVLKFAFHPHGDARQGAAGQATSSGQGWQGHQCNYGAAQTEGTAAQDSQAAGEERGVASGG